MRQRPFNLRFSSGVFCLFIFFLALAVKKKFLRIILFDFALADVSAVSNPAASAICRQSSLEVNACGRTILKAEVNRLPACFAAENVHLKSANNICSTNYH
jgi:hypothetical protein